MTRITFQDGSELVATIPAATLVAAIGHGSGKVGVQEQRTLRWRWVRCADIRAIDGRPRAGGAGR